MYIHSAYVSNCPTCTVLHTQERNSLPSTMVSYGCSFIQEFSKLTDFVRIPGKLNLVMRFLTWQYGTVRISTENYSVLVYSVLYQTNHLART